MTVINTAPTLVTERLRLDAHRLDDFESLAALWADPLVVRYIGGTPRDREDSWGRLMRYACGWTRTGWTTSSRWPHCGPIRWWYAISAARRATGKTPGGA
ncbi:GNAT family N-acetyltransferase [Serratia marcescens]|uniref:GNAT family N-acetyltransferase n=1 Tax=Serratia marcescens TaxID=615 RepID=UPI00339C8015